MANSTFSTSSAHPARPMLKDTGCTDTMLRHSDSSSLTNLCTGGGLPVQLPNGSIITSTATGTLQLSSSPHVAITAHVFDDNTLSRSLLSISDVCNAGCTATFTSTTATITHDDTGQIIEQSSKLPTDKLWVYTDHPTLASTPTAASAIHHEIHADYVKYASKSFGNPADSTFIQAAARGYLGNYPRLTAHMIRNNLPASIESAKGHLDRTRQGLRSTNKPKKKRQRRRSPGTNDSDGVTITPDSSTEEYLRSFFGDDDDIDDNDNVITKTLPQSSLTNYSDLTGKFPYTSRRGNNYILLSLFRGYIHVEPMASRSSSDYIKAYKKTFDFYSSHDHRPSYQRLDNETSEDLETYLRTVAKVSVSYVAPNSHRANKAERAIRSWKNHFIATLSSVQADFPMYLWDELLPQSELTINHMRPCPTDPTISAYHGMHGSPHDFLAHPIHPCGMLVLIYDSPETRGTWAPHGVKGYYLGPELAHYRCYKVFAIPTSANRIAETIALFPDPHLVPGAARSDLLYFAMVDLNTAMRTYADSPTNELRQLAEQAIAAIADIEQPASTTTPHQRVPDTTPNERVPTAILDKATHETLAPDVTIIPYQPHPTEKKPRHDKNTNIYRHPNKNELRSLLKKDFSRYHSYVGKAFTDTEDSLHFQIVKIVLPVSTTRRGKPQPFFAFYDTALHSSTPTSEHDYEHTPCAELVKAKYTIWDDILSEANAIEMLINENMKTATLQILNTFDTYAAAAHPIYPGLGGRQRSHLNAVEQNADTMHVTLGTQYIAQAFATYHSQDNEQPLNVNSDGSPLTYRSAMKGPDAEAWQTADGVEISKLIDSGTIRAIQRHEQPTDRRRDTTYYNPQVKEKLDADGNKQYRVRGTLGGDGINYPGQTSSPTADLAVVKLLLQAVVSDRRNKKTNTRFATLDLADFYLGSMLERKEYVKIHIKHIPADVIATYNLSEFIVDSHVLFEVIRCMYGHPVAGLLSNRDLVTHLAQHGYIQHKDIPCLFEHQTNGIQFTLIVDDFGIKYDTDAALDHLISILQHKWKLTTDRTGAKYIGMRIAWNYEADIPYFELDMPNIIPAAIKRFCPNGPPKGRPSPSIYTPFTPGKPDLNVKVDSSPLVSPEEKKFAEQVCGVYLYYSRIIDVTMYEPTTAICAQLSAPTKNTMKAIDRLIAYSVQFPNHKVRYMACDMHLVIASDASYLTLPRGGSKAGGHHYCTNKNDVDKINGHIQVLSVRIPTVCSAVSEAEYAAAFLNAQHGSFERAVLDALHYSQGITMILCDNTCAIGIANDTLTLKRSKAIDMRYHWLRDRVRLKNFHLVHRPGKQLSADFFTKALPVHIHQAFRPQFVTNSPTTLC